MSHLPVKSILLLCAVVPQAAFAAERAVVLDPAASKVSFTLDTTFHVVHGTIPLSNGTIRFDTDTGEASGEITVDARRADTGNESRDRTMHAEVLETTRYPGMVFRPRRVEGVPAGAGRSEVRITGVMNVHGADHPMTLTATVETGQGRVRGDMRFTIPYVEWGMRDPSFFVTRAAKTVDVVVRVEGRWGDGATSH